MKMVPAMRHPNQELAPGEQRGENRTSTVFRPVLIEAEDFAGFCLVRNISPSGLMGEVYTSIAPDTSALLHFAPSTAFQGKIKWCKNGQVGIEFDELIDVSQVLSVIPGTTFDGKVIRAPRLAIQFDGEVIVEGRVIPIEVQNISQKGLSVRAQFLEPGEEVEVRLGGMRGRKATVRWTRRGLAGLSFITPIPFTELAQWAIDTNLPPNRSMAAKTSDKS